LAPTYRQPRECEASLGHATAPTFFWGGEAARATGSVIAARLILMGVWRDSSQPSIEETGVLQSCSWDVVIDQELAADAAGICLLA